MSIHRRGVRDKAVLVSTAGGLSLLLALVVAADDLAAAVPNIVRGPYLQSLSTEGVTIHWRSSSPVKGRVWFADELAAPPADEDENADAGLDHAVRIAGLKANTRYFYAVGSLAEAAPQLNAKTYFITAPTVGSVNPLRFWVVGDGGWANTMLRRVTAQYAKLAGEAHTDGIILLGDNAYGSGTDEEYQKTVFTVFKALLPRTALWSTLGNHDVGTANRPYLDIFSFPKDGSSGGLPSGSELYYSYDVGNVHFVCLDSTTETHRKSGSPMYQWLEYDLAATKQEWTVAFWHHPPYTRGSYDSDQNPELIEMRSAANAIVEKYGTDLVLAGHSHVYERTGLLRGHFGAASTLTPAMKIDSRLGQVDAPYVKHQGVAGHSDGTVYVVLGSSSYANPGYFLDHPATTVALADVGSLVLDVEGSRLDARFLREDGTIGDHFVIEKHASAGPGRNPPPDRFIVDTPDPFSRPAEVPITVQATDPDGKVAAVELWSKGKLLTRMTTPPWTYLWKNLPMTAQLVVNGNRYETPYSVVARVFDDKGASTVSNTGTFVVKGTNQVPVIQVRLSPGPYVAPANMVFDVEATDPDGKVVAVELFESGLLVDTDRTPPFSFSQPAVGVGTYFYTFRAVDDRGRPEYLAMAQLDVTEPSQNAGSGVSTGDAGTDANPTDIDSVSADSQRPRFAEDGSAPPHAPNSPIDGAIADRDESEAAGAPDAGVSHDAKDLRARTQATGCSCDVGTRPSPAPLFFLLGIPFVLRLRSRGL